MRSRRSWWLIYAACAAVVTLAVGWVTVMALGLERSERAARTEAQHQEALRLALWRMDSWLAPLLAREAARPYFDYQPFYPQRRAYTALLDPIDPGDVLTASPLLSFESEYFSLHFQLTPDGRLTSPQAPAGDYRTLAANAYLSEERLVSNAAALEDIGDLVTVQKVAQCAPPPDAPPTMAEANAPVEIPRPDEGAQQLRNWQELSKRMGTYQQAVQAQQASEQLDREESVGVGSLVPFWTDGPGELIFVRAVRIGEQEYYQGFRCDWPKLREALLAGIADLFADASLVPVRGDPEGKGGSHDGRASGTRLATLPVALEVPPPALGAAAILTPARSTLLLTWLGVAAGLIAVAVTLRASIAFGEKRSRFASAVTHELRTPLTTFRMYSEMLADDMVRDAEQRQVYLDTLKEESGRLSSLVENVLAYARLEEGRGPVRRSPTTLGAVLSRVLPAMVKRAESAGMVLRVENEAADETPLVADADAVGQIIFNLVDNACKYSAGAAERTVLLGVRRLDGKVELRVRDHGPGVPSALAKAIFHPFERGRNNDDATPGVGLGLALARGLARDLGGDLVLEAPTGTGATFTLTLPAVPE